MANATSAPTDHKATARCKVCGWFRDMRDTDPASISDAQAECLAHVNATSHYIVAGTTTEYTFYIPGGQGDPTLNPPPPPA